MNSSNGLSGLYKTNCQEFPSTWKWIYAGSFVRGTCTSHNAINEIKVDVKFNSYMVNVNDENRDNCMGRNIATEHYG